MPLRREVQVKINKLNERYALISEKTGIDPRKERMAVSGFRRVKTENELTQTHNRGIIKMSNESVRKWYVANVSKIPNAINKSLPLEAQARQAFEMRNEYRRIAREYMADTETAKKLNKLRPTKTFDELLSDKMQRKGLTKQEALVDILETASKTNKDVNKNFGL